MQKLICHNENMTYCIADKYLLRIHQSKSGFNTVHFDHDIDTIKRCENELEFLMHLNANGLYVQSPIKNIDGKLVTVHRAGTVATMLTWLPGRTLNEDDLTDYWAMIWVTCWVEVHRADEGYCASFFQCC